MFYDRLMGQTRPEREVPLARTTYVAAARDFVAAMAGYIAAPPPLESRSGTDLPAWSRRDVQVVLTLQEAVNRLVETRRTYDQLARRTRHVPPR
ncbi:hypothetical protein ACIBSW_06830 [Actinoplanes sp. NPDC049668]|uniref:hypothetical protein n=1 Tax=unclassified Actinoplanes TaxID=2626549 RepID=UPI0033B57584